MNYSPEQIVGIAAKKGVACVSYEGIYQHIWKDKQAKGLIYTHLCSRGKRYKKRGLDYGKRGQLVGRVDISMRPAVVEQRVRFWGFGDGHHRGQRDRKGAILTINDRATVALRMKKLNGRNAPEIAAKCISVLA